MENEQLTIVFTGADSSTDPSLAGAWIRLEQPEWPYQGSDGFTEFLLEQSDYTPGEVIDLPDYMEYWEEYRSECLADEDGAICAEIWVHKFPADLNYRLAVLDHCKTVKWFPIQNCC